MRTTAQRLVALLVNLYLDDDCERKDVAPETTAAIADFLIGCY